MITPEDIYDANKYDPRGFLGNVALKKDGLMAYDPFKNTFLFGPVAKQYYEEGKFDFLDFAALHEDDHRRYFELTGPQQELLHKTFLIEMQQNSAFWEALLGFAEALYRHSTYFHGHQNDYTYWTVDNPNARGIKRHADGTSGVITLKLRKVNMPNIQVDNQGDYIEISVHIGMFLTELLSYMSCSQDSILWKKLTHDNPKFSDIAVAAKNCRDSMSLEFKKILARTGFAINRLIPDWRKYQF